MSASALVWANVAFAIAQWAVNAAHRVLPGGATIADRAAAVTTPIIPLGPAFAIWSLIFTGSLIYAVLGTRRRWREHPTFVALRPWTAVTFAANTAWELYVQAHTLDWLSVALIFVMLMSLVRVLGVIERAREVPPRIRAAAFWPLALFAGWINAAAFANISAAITATMPELASPTLWAGLLAAATVTAAAVCDRVSRQSFHIAGFLWALGWIAAKCILTEPRFPLLAGVAVAGGLALVLTAALSKRRRITVPPPNRYAARAA